MKSVYDPHSAVVDFFDEAFFERPHQTPHDDFLDVERITVHSTISAPALAVIYELTLFTQDAAKNASQLSRFDTLCHTFGFMDVVVDTAKELVEVVSAFFIVAHVAYHFQTQARLQGDDFAMDAFHDKCLSLDGVLYVDDINPLLAITVKKGVYDCLFCLDRETSFAKFPDQVVTDDVSVTGFQLTAFAVEFQLTSCSGFASQLIQPSLQICVLMTKSSPKVLVVIIGPTLAMLEPGDLSRHLEYRRRNDGYAINSLGKRQSDLDGHFFFCR